MDTLLERDKAHEAAIQRDKERLQGAWKFVSGIREAQLLIVGEHFTVTFTNGDVYLGVYLLDPTTRPKRMDLIVHEGPERHRGKTSLAIYEMDGDHLIWCPAEPGTGNRHSIFPPDDDVHHLCIVFRREKGRAS